MRRRICIALVVAAALAAVGAASATYPGATNGRIAFGQTANGSANPDIYSVLPNGRAMHQLTTDADFDACPAYSADGQWIAYCRGPSSSSAQLDTWIMRANGTDQHQVTFAATAGRAGFPDFAPDGSLLAVNCAPPGDPTAPDICTVGVDGAGLTQITHSPGPDLFPAWSPDGSKIVFLSNRTGTMQVWLMNADGSGQEQLTFDAAPKNQVPDWSPDGSQIAYIANVPAAPAGNIWVMRADGSDQYQVGSGGDEFGVAWSPDGTQIAFESLPSRAIETMNADGTGIRTIATGTNFVPAWQPRGVGDNGD